MYCFNSEKSEQSYDSISHSDCLLPGLIVSLVLIELLKEKRFNIVQVGKLAHTATC